MTDNKIIERLKEILEMMCYEGDLQRSGTISKALDLINRYKAEIERLVVAVERLEGELEAFTDDYIDLELKLEECEQLLRVYKKGGDE